MISLDGYNCLAVIMSFSTEEDAINAMLLEFGGEDVELVLDELRKCHQVEKVLRGKQCTERMHEIPKSVFEKIVTKSVTIFPCNRNM